MTRAEEEDIYLYLGEAMREARRKRVLMQRDVALGVGIKPSAISKMENGKNRPSFHQFILICRYMGADPAEVLADALGRSGSL